MLSCFVWKNKILLRCRGLPGVARVMPNRIYHLHTNWSEDFLQGDNQLADGILLKGVGVVYSGA